MGVYSGFTIVDDNATPPWGTTEVEFHESIIDTVVADCITVGPATSGHKHARLYDVNGNVILNTYSGTPAFECQTVRFNSGSGGSSAGVAIGSYTTDAYIGNTNAFEFSIKTNNTKRLRISSTGTYGFGVIPGTSTISVVDQNSNDSAISLFPVTSKYGRYEISTISGGGPVIGALLGMKSQKASDVLSIYSNGTTTDGSIEFITNTVTRATIDFNGLTLPGLADADIFIPIVHTNGRIEQSVIYLNSDADSIGLGSAPAAGTVLDIYTMGAASDIVTRLNPTSSYTGKYEIKTFNGGVAGGYVGMSSTYADRILNIFSNMESTEDAAGRIDLVTDTVTRAYVDNNGLTVSNLNTADRIVYTNASGRLLLGNSTDVISSNRIVTVKALEDYRVADLALINGLTNDLDTTNAEVSAVQVTANSLNETVVPGIDSRVLVLEAENDLTAIWTRYTVTYANFITNAVSAAYSSYHNLFTLEAGGVILGVKLALNSRFYGLTESNSVACTFAVGTRAQATVYPNSGTTEKYFLYSYLPPGADANKWNVASSLAGLEFRHYVSGLRGTENNSAGAIISIFMTTSPIAVDTLQAGAIDVWVLTSTLSQA